MRPRMLLLPALLVGVGCNDGAGPARLLVGKWGGENIGVTAEPQRVTIGFACATAEFKSAIVPDAAGDFTLRDGTMASWGASNVAVSARGHVDGDQMTLVVTTSVPQGVQAQAYVAQRDVPAVITLFCAVAERGS